MGVNFAFLKAAETRPDNIKRLMIVVMKWRRSCEMARSKGLDLMNW